MSSLFVDAVRAFQSSNYLLAADIALSAATKTPQNILLRHAATYLAQVAERGRHDLYASPEGFQAFVRGGGNVPLYQNLSRSLREFFDRAGDSLSLLEIGVGDGLALLPAITNQITHIDLVEPSTTMLDQTAAELTKRGVGFNAFNQPIERFIATHQREQHYDIAQATFALHNLPPASRRTLFSWLSEHAINVLIAEFDVHLQMPLNSADHIDYLFARYEQGLSEYGDSQPLVAQGFLMPILFRNFEAADKPAIYEQPIGHWRQELTTAGFKHTEQIHIYDYWWANAYLLIATQS